MNFIYAIPAFTVRAALTIGAGVLITGGIHLIASLFSLWPTIAFAVVWPCVVGTVWYHLMKRTFRIWR